MTLNLPRRGLALMLAAGLLAALLTALVAAGEARAQGKTTLEGRGSGIAEIANPEECELTGICDIEIRGDFDASDSAAEIAGSVAFSFTDDRSGISARAGACSAPAPGTHIFVWSTEEGDILRMTQTLGFMCPSEDGESGYWKRFLRVDGGTGRFDGASGTVFISGSTDFETGEVSWSFSGDLATPATAVARLGCYRAYFIGNTIVIPPSGSPAPTYADFRFWLCGDDISLVGPDPRDGYEIFNPREDE